MINYTTQETSKTIFDLTGWESGMNNKNYTTDYLLKKMLEIAPDNISWALRHDIGIEGDRLFAVWVFTGDPDYKELVERSPNPAEALGIMMYSLIVYGYIKLNKETKNEK